jgi:hypothetical protein
MLGQRGISDSAIPEKIVFLTPDSEFEKMPGGSFEGVKFS